MFFFHSAWTSLHSHQQDTGVLSVCTFATARYIVIGFHEVLQSVTLSVRLF